MILAERLLEGMGGTNTIAVVSAPSVFVQLKNLLVSFTSPSYSQSAMPPSNEEKMEEKKGTRADRDRTRVAKVKKKDRNFGFWNLIGDLRSFRSSCFMISMSPMAYLVSSLLCLWTT